MKITSVAIRVGIMLLLIVLIFTLTGCRRSRLLSMDEEIRLGQQAGDEFEREHGRDHDPARNAMLGRIATRIAAAAKPPDYPYDFRILANDQINAVAFPGGRIYFYRGIFTALKNDEHQLAWVAGHEAVHISRQHAVRRLERSLGYELLIQLVFGRDTSGQIAGMVTGLMLQDYGRDNELEADRIGVQYAHAAGYDSTAALAVLAEFAEIQGKDPGKFEQLFMSHPTNTARSDAIKQFLRQQGWSGRYFRP